ncbi:MAG: hypothetical protein IBX69_18045, partial [Anaerolineales bacterium]|nr:hypothetical protein [Anaerolineales bacterium]
MKISYLKVLVLFILVTILVSCSPPEITPTSPDKASPTSTADIAPTSAGEFMLFLADRTALQSGECTHLRWEVTAGFGVTLDAIPVPKAGEKEVCPLEIHTYELAVDMGTHLEQRWVEIIVSQIEPDESPPQVAHGIPAYQAGAWVSTGGPPGGLGYDIRMHPHNPDIMYVTDAWAGAFKSTDGGANWFPVNNGITARVGPSGDGIPIFSLTIDPNNPQTVWAGTQFSGSIFRSDDGGESWRSMSSGILEKGLTIRGISIEPGNSDVVYLAGEISSWDWNPYPISSFGLDATKGVVYKTTDGGHNWRRLWLGDNLARYIWIHPEDHNRIYVSTGIFDRAAANGEAARVCLENPEQDGCNYNPELSPSKAAALDPGGVGILRSRDGGTTWEVLASANGFRSDELYFGSLFMHPDNPDILLAAAGNDVYPSSPGRSHGAIYLTENGGDHWERVLELHNASVVEICTNDPRVMYAGSIVGIYRSMDSGHSWTEVAGHLWGSEDVLAGFPIDMQCDPRDPMRIFINNYLGGNFLSEDGGQTWQVSSNGYSGALLRQVGVSAGDAAHVYSASRMGVFVSHDYGDNWHGTAFFPARSPEGIIVAVDPFDGNHILSVFLDAGPDPKVSWDGGRSWSVVNTGLFAPGKWTTGSFTHIVFSPYDSNLVLAAAGFLDCYKQPPTCRTEPGYGILRSTDGGQTWSQTSLNDAHVFDLKFVSQTLAYAAAYPDTIYRSIDGGQTWEVADQGITAQIP